MHLTVFGMRITLSFWFFALVAVFLLLDREVLFFYLLLPVVVHELGHLLVMAVWGVGVREVRCTALGVEIRRDRGRVLSYGQELLVCFGGPAANLLLALFLHIRLFATVRVMFLVAANLAVALFNLLPIGNLDGGQMLRLVAERFFTPNLARAVSRTASLAVLTALFAASIFLLLARWHNPTLLVTCVYLAVQVIGRE